MCLVLKILQSSLLVAFLLAGLAHAQEIDPDDVIRVKTTLVNSPVLVIGRDGKFVPNLHQEDFAVFENGVKQEISYFAPVDNPFTVALLIDTTTPSESPFSALEAFRYDCRVHVEPDRV